MTAFYSYLKVLISRSKRIKLFYSQNAPHNSLHSSLSWFLIFLLLFISTVLSLHGFLHHHHFDIELSVFNSDSDAALCPDDSDSEFCPFCLLLRAYQATLQSETVLVYSGTSTELVIHSTEIQWTPQISEKGRSPPLLIILSI
jgi:hypothetical protein